MGKFFSVGEARAYIDVVAKVDDVLDVNLLRLDNHEVVKLVGIEPARPVYQPAFIFLQSIVLGREIILECNYARKDIDGNRLGFVYIKVGKNFEHVKDIQVLEKDRNQFLYFEPSDESGEEPKDFWILDNSGNKSINPQVAKQMRPKGNLYLQINLALITGGFADFKSMPPDTCMDGLFVDKYNDAIKGKKGIWG